MTADKPVSGNFASPEHAFRAGEVFGLALKHGLDLTPVMDDEGNYTPRYELRHESLPEHVHIFITIEPPVGE